VDSVDGYIIETKDGKKKVVSKSNLNSMQ